MALTVIKNLDLTSSVTGTLPAANGGTGATSYSPGKVLQVINAVVSTETVVSNDTFTDTGLTASITPSSTSSKILILACCTGLGKATNNTYGKMKLLRGSTGIVENFEERLGNTSTTTANKVGGVSCTYLDSPSSTSATSYKVQIMSGNDNAYMQMGNSSSKSTMTLMEIGA